jgi:hypothetical protein
LGWVNVARRKKMQIRRKLLSPRSLLVEESRGSVAVTVAWMLTLFLSGVALLIAGLAFVAALSFTLAPAVEKNVVRLAGLMTLIAAVTGLLCLVLTVVVYRVRRDPPPIAITVAAVVVGVFPISLLLFLAW